MSEPATAPPSTAPATAPRARRAARADARLQACHAGVVLRTLLAVHVVAALVLGLGADGAAEWLGAVSAAIPALLSATLAWLGLVCTLDRRLAAARRDWRLPLAVLAGALCALGGGALGLTLQAALGLAWPPLPALAVRAVAAAGCGAAVAAGVTGWLAWRARLRVPAATQARLTELQSRIRPHFLFNALNSAVALVRVDPGRAEEVLEDLSELFRAALVGAGEQVSLGEEIALARRYLAIEEVRFGERLQVHWVLDAAANAARVPSLLLQPLVENAVRHGVEPAPEGGELVIRTQVHKGQALISITNSVPSQPARPGQGMALRNVRERLALLHDVTMRFEAGPVDGARWRVRIAVPLGEPA